MLAGMFLGVADDVRYKRLGGKQAEAVLRAYEAALRAFEMRLRYGTDADKPWE